MSSERRRTVWIINTRKRYVQEAEIGESKKVEHDAKNGRYRVDGYVVYLTKRDAEVALIEWIDDECAALQADRARLLAREMPPGPFLRLEELP